MEFEHNGKDIPNAPVKDPQERVSYGVDWSSKMREGATIVDSQWVLLEAEGGLTIEDPEISGNYTRAFFSGGIEFEDYRVTNRVRISGGGETVQLDRSFTLKIRSL